MRTLSHLSLCFLSLIGFTTLTHGAGILWQDDFETSGGHITSGTALTYLPVANPSGIGTSLLLTDTGAAGSWGAEIFAPNGRVYTFSNYGAVAGVDKLTYTVDVYIPATTVAVADNFYVFTRVLTATGVDGGGATERVANLQIGNLARGQWHTLSGEFLMPATANNNGGGSGTSPATRVAAFLSYNDAGATNVAGPLLYVDNIQIGITPEPSQALLIMTGLLAGLYRRQRVNPASL